MAEPFRKELVQRIVRNLLDIQLLRLTKSQPMWGYRMKQQAEAKFGVKIRHGALYPLLNALEKQGYLTSQKQLQGGRTRKVYTITEKGEQYIETYNTILGEQIERRDLE